MIQVLSQVWHNGKMHAVLENGNILTWDNGDWKSQDVLLAKVTYGVNGSGDSGYNLYIYENGKEIWSGGGSLIHKTEDLSI